MKKIVSFLLLVSSSLGAVVIPDENLQELWKDPEKSAQTLVDNMSFREKLGQMMMFDFRHWGKSSENIPQPFLEMNDNVSGIINQYHIGSVILFRENLVTTEQTVNLINALQAKRTSLPLFISTDQEGGYVTRMQEGTEMPGNMALGATRNPALAELAGMIHGYELSSLGFNFNFGPVVDVNNNQNNPVIGVRSYSDRPALVEELANSYIEGINKYRIATSVKHFPGHGNVSSDTHFALPTINIDEKTWRELELKPFIGTIKHTDAVMTAHVSLPALDSQKVKTLTGSEINIPATLSKPILTGILRDELKFDGLIFTDAMDMGAISSNFDMNWAVKSAILAGVDIVLMPIQVKSEEDLPRLVSLYDYLEKEAQTNAELKKRIDDSAKRVISKKLQHRIKATPVDVNSAKTVVASKGHKAIENMISERSITLIKNEKVLPYQLKEDNRFLIISDEKPRNELMKKHLAEIASDFEVVINTDDQVVKLMLDDADETSLINDIKQYDLVILATYNLKSTPVNAQRIIDVAKSQSVPVIVIASRNPYDIAYLNNVDANLAIYGITGFDVTNNVRNSLETNIRSGLRTLFTDAHGVLLNKPRGLLPVDIKSPDDKTILYPYGHGLRYE